jgi:hypothetical protein
MKHGLMIAGFLCALSASGQLYKTSFGLRLDDSQLGFNFTQRLLPTLSAEGFLDLETNEVRAGAALRPHFKLAGKRLNWYPTAGVFVAQRKNVGSAWGMVPGVGAEYKFILAPVVISFDLVPHIYLTPSFPDYLNFQTVFSVKYILVKDKRIQLPKRREEDD